MSPDYANRIEPPPTGALSRPTWLSSSLGQFVLFHDNGMLYAYLSSGQLAWHIKARIGIAGFAVTDDNLYVQDGDVLCQYDATALQSVAVKLPVNAISFRSAAPGGWSYQDGDGGAKFESWFAAPMPAPAPAYSAPVVLPGDNQIHVLRSDGTVFSALLNLEAAIGTIRIQATRFTPDDVTLYRQPVAGDGRQLCWISGGKIASLSTGELEPAPTGIEAWRWDCLKASGDQPWQSFSSPAFTGFMSQALLGSSQCAAVTLRDVQAAQWTFHVVDPACHPVFSSKGAMLVESSGKIVGHGNPGIPAGLTISLPPANAHERAGVIKARNGEAVEIACAPYLREENGILFAYVIANDPAGPSFCKYRVPAATDDYVLAWWQSLQQAHARLQPILATEIMYSLADAAQQAIDSKIIPAAALAKPAQSPLWSATTAGLIPWMAFDGAPPKYQLRLAHAVFVTPISMTYKFSREDQFIIHGRPRPIVPLFGPFWLSDGASEFATLCDTYGIYGFNHDNGALAWQVPARGYFKGWTVVANRFLYTVEGPFLAQYDMATFSGRVGIDDPNVYFYLQWGGASQPGDNAFNYFFTDKIVTEWSFEPFVQPQAYSAPRYDDAAHRLRVQSPGWPIQFLVGDDYPKGNGISFALDGTGAIVLGSAFPDDNFAGNPAYDHDLATTPAPTADWRPNTGPLPGGLAVGGNPPAWVTTKVAAVPLNTSDNQTVAVSGTPYFRQEGSGWFLYACLKKADRYFFAKFAIPN